MLDQPLEAVLRELQSFDTSFLDALPRTQSRPPPGDSHPDDLAEPKAGSGETASRTREPTPDAGSWPRFEPALRSSRTCG